MRDQGPRNPPDRTLCAHRRPCHRAPHGAGRRPELSDAELLTLAVAQVLCGYNGEHRWIRHIHASDEWRAMFPYIPNQPAYNKRLRAAHGLLCSVIRVLAEVSPSWFDDLWITDATPVPCGMSRETAKRSDLAGTLATATVPPIPATTGE